MYKIFINDMALHLTDKRPLEVDGLAIPVNKKFQAKKFVKEKLSESGFADHWLWSKKPSKALKKFKKKLVYVRAAGGVVVNDSDEIMLIRRYGTWDLPKGKLVTGEKKKAGAIREVMEETGARDIEIIEKIRFAGLKQNSTYHTYIENGNVILKSTWWYLMHCGDCSQLEPEKSEGIDKILWVSMNELPAYLDKTYRSLRDVLNVVRTMV